VSASRAGGDATLPAAPTAVAAKVRVIYGDTDMMGVAYYGNYLRWFEIGRNELIRARGMTYRQFEERGLMLPVSEAHVKYLKSAVYDDVLEIHTRAGDLGRVRMEFVYEVWRAEGASGPRALIATGSTVHACLAMKGSKPTRVPDDVLAMLRI
jgi:acyl-CoA thioester hydrolase